MNDEIIENHKRRITNLGEKLNRLNTNKFVLFRELERLNKNLDFNGQSKSEIQEKISYLNDWIEFHSKEIQRHKSKLEKLEQSVKDQSETKDIENSFKLIFKEEENESTGQIKAQKTKLEEPDIKIIKKALEEKKFNIREPQSLKTFVKYGIPFTIILLIVTSLFMLKPSTTGYVALSKETLHNKTLNLKLNESGNYAWTLDKQGTIKSIMASGSFSGNGTIRIYIEKDGKKYLIYDNKQK